MTSIYVSTNARPCASCHRPQGRCLPTCPDRSTNPFDREPTIMPIGEIVFEDGTSMLVPQPVQIDPDGLTFTGVIRAIEKDPEIHAEGRSAGPWAPMWGLVLVFVGSVLAALGLVFRDPIALMIWEMIHA